MPVVLTAPRARGLDDAALDRAAGLLGGDAGRLGPAAGEIAIEDAAQATLADLAAALPGIDVNAVPAAGRRKRLLIADMDSTIIPVECIDELADMAGVGAEVAAVTERAMRGELDFEGALEARVATMAGADAGLVAQVLAERITLNPGARALVATMAAHGAHTMLVSGGFTAFVAPVAAEAGFAAHQANTLEIEGGRLTGRVGYPILGREAKRAALERALVERGLSPADALAVGDGANDLAMVRLAGLGVAYRAKPALAAEADARIDHGELDALLALQGYREAEIVGA